MIFRPRLAAFLVPKRGRLWSYTVRMVCTLWYTVRMVLTLYTLWSHPNAQWTLSNNKGYIRIHSTPQIIHRKIIPNSTKGYISHETLQTQPQPMLVNCNTTELPILCRGTIERYNGELQWRGYPLHHLWPLFLWWRCRFPEEDWLFLHASNHSQITQYWLAQICKFRAVLLVWHRWTSCAYLHLDLLTNHFLSKYATSK